MAISVPSSVLASGWVPFVVVILIILVISTIYIKYYNSRRDGECSSTLGAIFALSISMMTTALIPVDIFLVSFMKDSNGTFKDWATDNSTRDSVESSVMAGYYTMYGLVTFCMFLLLPFMYFYYEERDEEEQPSWKSRCCGAMKYMIVFLIMIFVLLLIGALVHTKPIPNASNSTQFEKMKALFDMESNWLENSLSLVISILSLIGMVTLFVYTAYGMAALPIGLIKGHRNIKREKLQVQSRKSETQERIAAIREKYSRGKKMSRRDAREISDLEESEALMKRQERHLVARDTCCQKCWLIFRPFGIIIGIALILIAILVFLSLLFANIDKAMNGAGLKFGYTLSKKSTLPNPVDIMLVFCQKVFPLDYIMFALLVFYFVFCSMSGLRNIGIWFFWLRMYRIRPGRTAPQGMMMMCMILMFITLAINIIMYELTPQYSAYGSQHFWNHTSNQLEVCSTKNTQDECVMTRMALLLTRFFYKMWIFGAAYYWGTWAFLFEEKEALLKRNQEAREKREDYRKKTENAIKIQKVYRGYRVRQKQNKDLREDFDNYLLKISRDKLAVREVMNLSTQLCHFYRDKEDGSRLVWLSQQLIMKKEEYVTVVLSEPSIGQQQIKNMLALCLRYLTTIGNTSQPVAIPLRMLEVFTSSASYSKPDVLCGIWKFLIDNGYFDCMRLLLNAKVPSSLEKSSTPPTPVSATLYELIMVPISYAANCKDKSFSHHVLRMVCKSLLCPVYTEQISQFLLPAMAYGKYPFPFVDLIHALIYHCKLQEVGEGKNKGYGRTSDRLVLKLESTPWLLGAFLALGEKYVESLKIDTFSVYLQVVQRLFILLPARKHEDEEDSESEDDMDIEEENLVKDRLAELRDQCLRILDSQVHVQKSIALVTSHPDDNDVINALSVICHNLMSQHRHSIHRKRLLYTLAYNSRFIRSLWRCCVSLSTISATKTETPLVIMLCRGLSMSERDVNRIVPVLSTFCSMFNHSLLTLHDVEFYGDSSVKSSSMPFSLDELVNMMITLRDVCLGIVELAHPDAKPTVNEDYRIALNRTGGKTRNNNVKDTTKETAQWSYLFKVTAALVRQAYTRDARRSFCPKDLWLSDRVKIQADGPSHVYRAQDSMFRRRPFRTMQTFLGINRFDDEGGPPLSNKDMKNSVILTELPFVVPFQERVKMLQKLIQTDKEGRQEDIDFGHFGHGHNIHVMIRRNFIYEDAFDKLSKANEPDLKKKMRVQLVNAAGLDEAGIDGGGIFREFLTVLLKASFDPNRGFFSQTTDRVLYPNPQSSVLVENYRDHYFFIGRMLGKAIYENMLIELPFAAFFLSKILSRTSGDLDIHHLASLDPDLYKNLLFLKHYDGDVAELELDFTAVNNEFGETKVEELKPGGRNIEVTNANRIEYIHLMADYKLNKQIRTHTMSFREGLSDLINLEWLRMFDQHELQVLISGSSVPINIEDLKQHTNYSGGYTADHPVITMFWDIVERFSDEQRGQLLKFITSCSRPPLLGFKDLYPALCIHYGGNEAERLPTASTCMNLLKLPECLDETTLKQKLLYAIESGAGFELS